MKQNEPAHNPKMNLEEILIALDVLVFTETGKHLKEVDATLFRGAWQGKTYEQIVENNRYSLTYIKQAAGPKLWKLLTKVLGENVSKTNLRSLIEKRWDKISQPVLPLINNSASLLAENQKPRVIGINPNSNQVRDWGEAPDVSIFYGRKEELDLLEQWTVRDRCRLIAIVGIGGIGKTALSVRCAKQVEQEFEYVIWRSLRHASSKEQLAVELLASFSSKQETKLLSTVEESVSQLIDHLQKHRCLLLLENVETIMRSGELAGYYQEQYQDYRELIQTLAAIPHQSCLILTSRDQLKEIALLEGKTLPVRSLQLTGLHQDARKILAAKNLLEPDKWDDLIELYRGNPLALKMVSNTIQDLFGGRVTTFLKHQTIIFGDLEDLLDEQFERLSNSEEEILYWLGIESSALSLTQLLSNPRFPLTPGEIMEVLESLLRRSLIDKTVADREVFFALQQPVVAQYVISQAIEKLCQEIQTVSKSQKLTNMKFLSNYVLWKKADSDDSEQKQKSWTLTLITEKLYSILRDEQLIEEQLVQILTLLKGKTPLTIGYAKENIQNLLLELNTKLNDQKIFNYS